MEEAGAAEGWTVAAIEDMGLSFQLSPLVESVPLMLCGTEGSREFVIEGLLTTETNAEGLPVREPLAMGSPQQIVVSLEIAKRLAKAGWPQDEATFFWALPKMKHYHKEQPDWELVYDGHCEKALTNNAGYTRENEPLSYYISDIEGGNEYSNDQDVLEVIAAPTAEEILRKLPTSILNLGAIEKIFLLIDRNQVNEWEVIYANLLKSEMHYQKNDASLANAAASMACYLVEQGLLSFKND